MHRLWLIVHEPLDAFIVQGGAEVPALVCGSILLALSVTRAVPPVRTPSMRQSANISGLFSGLLCAVWACGHTTGLPQAYELSPFAAPLATAGVVLARLTMGVVVAVGGEQVVKAVMTAAVSKVLQEPKGYKSDRVYIPVKYLAQTWMAIGIVCAPAAMAGAQIW